MNWGFASSDSVKSRVDKTDLCDGEKNYRSAQNSMYWSDHAQVAIEIPGHYCDALLTTSISLVAGFKAACIAAMTRHAASIVQRVRGYEVHPRDWGLGAAQSQF